MVDSISRNSIRSSDEVTDLELLESWRAGEERAGSKLIERHYRAVFRFFRSKSAELAEDLAQITFVSCVDSREGYSGKGTFRAFLFGIARNVLYRELRTRRRRPRLDFTTISAAEVGLSPSAVIVEHEEQRLLLQALRHLPLDDQILLEMYEWEKITAREIAQVFDITIPAVRSRIRRAMERLKNAVLELAKNPDLRESISGGFEQWVRSIKASPAAAAGAEPGFPPPAS